MRKKAWQKLMQKFDAFFWNMVANLARSQLPTAIFPHRASIKGSRMKPTCEQKQQKWRQKRAKGSLKAAQRVPKVNQNASKDRRWDKIEQISPKRSSAQDYPGPFWRPFPTKNRKKASKKVCRNRCRKSIEN